MDTSLCPRKLTTPQTAGVPLSLSLDTYRRKVMGCWLGKNAGGTLGAPLEKAFGERQPFNVSFYPDLRPGGIPNDDLEIQLVWLLALEERGLDVTCRDLAEYWLNYIRYNPDEYGLHKTNVRQGLRPPVSGWYNNYFRDCMGSPIRSEIWACIAPGLPDVAAHYAWHDAVVDHAMGESVYGEMFNAALESAAFFIEDRDALLDLGLSVIPPDCMTARAIRKARESHASGMSWLDARNAVLDFAYSPIAQFSPVNLAFQTLGWLYGQDFGDALCKAVNCGWDTDCTGATLGSILGLVMGADRLPEKWIQPLGRTIATSIPSGGLRAGPFPMDIDDLTERTLALGRQVVARYADRVAITDGPVPAAPARLRIELVDRRRIDEILRRPQNAVLTSLPGLEVFVDHSELPVVAEKKPVAVGIRIRNRGVDPVRGRWAVELPRGFSTTGAEASADFSLEGLGETRIDLRIVARRARDIGIANRLWLRLHLHRRPAVEAIPIVLMGARRWLVSRAAADQSLDSDDGFVAGLTFDKPGTGSPWRTANWCGNELLVEPHFKRKPGVLYLRHFARSPQPRKVILGVPTNARMKLWLNGLLVKTNETPIAFRPNLTGDGANYVTTDLPEGWSQVVIKLERGREPIETHFTVACDEPFFHGVDDLEQTRFPWEVKEE